MSTQLMVSIVLFFFGVCLAESQEYLIAPGPQNGTVITANDVNEALEHHFKTYGQSNETGIGYLISETGTFVTDITYPPSNTTGRSIQFNANNAPLGTWFHQYQIARNGYWNTQWEPVSGCFGDYLGDGGSEEVSWSKSISAETGGGFSISFSAAVQASWGIEITKEWGQSESYSCTSPGGSTSVQVWASKGMAWHDQQRQKCVRRHYGHNGLHCDAWGPYIHGDMPTKYSFNVGCSAGANTDCGWDTSGWNEKG